MKQELCSPAAADSAHQGLQIQFENLFGFKVWTMQEHTVYTAWGHELACSHSLTRSLTHSLARSLTHSLTSHHSGWWD